MREGVSDQGSVTRKGMRMAGQDVTVKLQELLGLVLHDPTVRWVEFELGKWLGFVGGQPDYELEGFAAGYRVTHTVSKAVIGERISKMRAARALAQGHAEEIWMARALYGPVPVENAQDIARDRAASRVPSSDGATLAPPVGGPQATASDPGTGDPLYQDPRAVRHAPGREAGNHHTGAANAAR